MLSPLYAILDLDVCARTGWAPRDLARAYLAGGARLLQLRAKTLAGAELLDLAAALVDDARRSGAAIVINDRADIAAMSGADGVHVGQDDVPPGDVRRIVGPEAIVGLSTHTPAQVDAALAAPVSYLAVGPVFPTVTKATGYDQVGLELVRVAARAVKSGVPVVAIGGITLETAPSVIAAGAASVAVITDLVCDDPAARVRAYLAALS